MRNLFLQITLKPLLGLWLFVFSNFGYAEIYAFVDEAGVSHYSNVPTDQRYVLVFDGGSESHTVQPKQQELTENNATGDTQDSETSSKVTLQNRTELKSDSGVNDVFTEQALFAHIEKTALAHQVNSALIQAVVEVESAYHAKARSKKGAQGLMQLMPATATRFGVNDPLNPLQNVEGGAKYLRYLLNLYDNDLTLTLAAYNAGEQAVLKYGNRVPPYKETMQYVPKVINKYKKILAQQQTKKI